MVFLMLLLDLNYYKTIEAYTCLSLWEKAESQITAMIIMIYSLHSRHYFAESGGDKVKCNVRETSADPEKRVKKISLESSLLTVDWSSSTSLTLLLMFTINLNQVNQ